MCSLVLFIPKETRKHHPLFFHIAIPAPCIYYQVIHYMRWPSPRSPNALLLYLLACVSSLLESRSQVILSHFADDDLRLSATRTKHLLKTFSVL